jgi:Tfp pilus assembly protein PilV
MCAASGQNSLPQLHLKGPSRAVTLVEVMFALVIQATVMLGIIGTFIQSRRVTESAVLHAAATSMVYGLIEQMKEMDYTSQVPSDSVDTFAPTGTGAPVPPYVRIRINQNVIKWIQVVHTLASTTAAPTTPQGPTTKPDPGATAASVGAIDNWIGSIPLSTVTGTTSQQINLNLWLWIDEIPDPTHDVLDAKKFTLVYTYQFQDGGKTRTIRDMEVFVRTHYDQ